MDDVAIRIEGLSKMYRIGERRQTYATLREVLTTSLKSPFNRVRSCFQHSADSSPREDNLIWALKDVSLNIMRGEIVGVIGRNGAGKSTLLKILSRITEPTHGFAEIRGRIASLLEVGTGFHPELTGRENIALCGAILGMRRTEIDHKFDEIVAFAEIEKFIDTPVKHYSSGMYLRLAFSVAAHLEPDILLVDEVLAVGDDAFQRKCLGKMDDVASEGRTVLFVSHNLGVIKELCQTSIVLNNGRVDFHGPVLEGLMRYSGSIVDPAERHVSNGAGWRGLRINGAPNGIPAGISSRDQLFVESWLDLNDEIDGGHLFLIMHDSIGNTILHLRIKSDEVWFSRLAAGRYHVRVDLPTLWLAPGVYTLHFKFIGRGASLFEQYHFSERATLDVIGSVSSLSKAHLAPTGNWTVTRETGLGETASVPRHYDHETASRSDIGV